MNKPAQLKGPMLRPSNGKAPDALVVLVHGFGSNGADMIALAPQWRHVLPGALFVAPNGPEPCYGSAGGFQWWGLHDLTRTALAAGAARAAPALDGFIDALLAEHGLGEDRLLLVGFSQGTMMALHIAPRRERPVAGVIGYSGMLADPAALANDIRSKPPILLVHGERDDVVPLIAFHEARNELRRRGFEVSSHSAPGVGHGVDPVGLQLGAKFARERLYGTE